MDRLSVTTLYDNIYRFIFYNIFVSNYSDVNDVLGHSTINTFGLDITLRQWLCHTCTIAIMILAVILCCLLIRWVWRLVTSAFLLK